MKNQYCRLILPLVLSLLFGCADKTTGPEELDLSGTFKGNYYADIDPGTTYEGTLQITQTGTNVVGTLTTTAGRSGDVSATLTGNRLNGNLQFTDSCGGSATTMVDVVEEGNRLIGNYQADDCLGEYSGSYDLRRQ